MLLLNHHYENLCLEIDILKPWTLTVSAAFGPNPNLLESFTECHHPSFQARSLKRRNGVQFLISVTANASEPIAALSRGLNNSNHRDTVFPRQGCSSLRRSEMISRFGLKNWLPRPLLWRDADETSGWHGVRGRVGRGDSVRRQLSVFVTAELQRLLISTGSHHLSSVTNVFIVAGKINLFPSGYFEEQEVGGGTACA